MANIKSYHCIFCCPVTRAQPIAALIISETNSHVTPKKLWLVNEGTRLLGFNSSNHQDSTPIYVSVSSFRLLQSIQYTLVAEKEIWLAEKFYLWANMGQSFEIQSILLYSLYMARHCGIRLNVVLASLHLSVSIPTTKSHNFLYGHSYTARMHAVLNKMVK